MTPLIDGREFLRGCGFFAAISLSACTVGLAAFGVVRLIFN